MKYYIFFIVALAVVLMCCSCSSVKVIEKEQAQKLDSIHIEHKELVTYVRDTTCFEIPKQTQEVFTEDSISVLENDYALSLVQLHKNGKITHSLKSKPQRVAVPYLREERQTKQYIYKETKQENQKEKISQPTSRFGGWFIDVLKAACFFIFGVLVALLSKYLYNK